MFNLDDLFDSYGEEAAEAEWLGQRRRAPRAAVGEICKFCLKPGLKWRETDAGWRLFDTERVHPGNYMPEHNCRAAPADPDEFDIA